MMLDILIRCAHHLPLLLLLWLGIAYSVACTRTPHNDRGRRFERTWVVSETVLAGMVHLIITLTTGKLYLGLYDMILFGLMLAFAMIRFFWLISGQAATPDYQHPVDILLLRHPAHQVPPINSPEENLPKSCQTKAAGVAAILAFMLIPITILLVLPNLISPSHVLWIIGFFFTLIIGPLFLSPFLILIVIFMRHIRQSRRSLTTELFERSQQPGASAIPSVQDFYSGTPAKVYNVGIIVAFLAIISVIGVLLQPCNLLDQLAQYSGCQHFIVRSAFIMSTAVSPDGTLVASAERDQIYLRRITDGSVAHTLEKPGFARSVTFSPDGALLAAGRQWVEGPIAIWGIINETILWELPHQYINDIQFSPDGTLLAITGSEGSQLWRTTDQTRVWRTNNRANDVEFSADGTILFVTNSNGLTIRELPAMEIKQVIADARMPIASSPDGTLVAAALGNNRIGVWHATDSTQLHSLVWPNDQTQRFVRVGSLIFSPNGTLLAAGGSDDTFRIWRVSDGALLHTFIPGNGLRTSVDVVAFVSDDTLIVADNDENIRQWRIQP